MRPLVAVALVVLLLGAVPAGVAAQDNSTATPTPTPTPGSDGGDSGSADSPPRGDETVSVYVEQPRYVSQPVKKSVSDDGVNTYTVRGSIHELDPDGFNQSAVVRADVREDSATLTYDKGIDRWLLDVQGTAGTYRVFWTVREGSQTRTYVTNIKVEAASYKHVSPGQYDDLQSKAELLGWITSEFESAGLLSSDANNAQIKSVVGDAVTWYEFYVHPFTALTGQFFTLGMMLIRWPAGWIILGGLLLGFFIFDRRKTKQNRRYKRQFSRIEDVDEAERRAEERELKRILSMRTFTDMGLTESDAEAVKEHCDADNPRQFLDKIRDYLSERRMVRLLLGAHEQAGHKVRVRRDDMGSVTNIGLVAEPFDGEGDLAADGGTAAGISGEDGGVGGIEYLLPTECDDELVLQLDWTDLDPEILWDERVDARALPLPIANDAEEDDDLVAEFDIPIGEDGHDYYILERREEFAELLLTFIKHVAASDYTNDDGHIRPDADVVDFLYTFTAVSAEKYRWSLHNTRDILLRCRQLLDADDRMDDVAERSRDGDL